MKSLLLLLLSLTPSYGFAAGGNLSCVGDGLTYSIVWPNGGAPVPTEHLVVQGTVLIDRGLNVAAPVAYASFRLQGAKTVTSTIDGPVSTTIAFTQAALVEGPHPALHPPLQFFQGAVSCTEVDSKLPPLP